MNLGVAHKRDKLKREPRMTHYEYDLVVIGSGPSGRRAAIQAAKWGHSVLVIENRAPGAV